ncbi:FimV N-terminal domain protein [Thiorhodococcus drewsii AZ1]|uniref:FimV N-terminal domain protein n=1 Tax=Thiorhodococcus drewsii AZ1 TaxID=765913 RepID=G2DW62_9GAMM|nr:ClcB-like voltage-gated chloride channel protein [Thiorhodococcus drewsii]EGV33782.1 FimV N-terminal domain protein [Thiorhodococcus drewsii AZ1]
MDQVEHQGGTDPDRTGLPRPAGHLGWLLAAILLTGTEPGFAGQSYGPVRSGESLWMIAGRIETDRSLNRDQIMLALLHANPTAFSTPCNVNGTLRLGAVLRIPDEDQITALDTERARAEVAEQNRAWRAHLARGTRLTCLAGPPEMPNLGDEAPAAAPPPTEDVKPAPAAPSPASTPESACPPAPSVASAPCPCSCSDSGAAQPTESERANETSPQPGLDEARPSRLAPGPRAPGWLLVPLVLVLVTAAMFRWERRRTIADTWRAPRSVPGAMLEAATKLPKRALTLLSPSGQESRLLLPLAALAGILGALVTVVFREGIHGLEWLLSGYSGSLVAMAMSLPPWERFLLPAAGGLAAGLVLQEIGQRLRGLRTTDYMEAIVLGDGRISIRQSLVKGASSLCTVASGGSIGREGAMVQLSAMVASTLGRLLRFERDSMRLLVAAGAAAGLASAYNAPIAATIFVAEIVLGSIAIDHIGPLIIAAVIANITVHDLLGYAPVYDIPNFHIVSDWELGLYLVLGLIAGHVAPVFLNLLERSHQLFARLPLPLAARLGLGGLIVGAISVYEPQVWGNGYSVVNSVLLAPWIWQALLTVLVLKMLATAATHGSGAVGGAFTPTLFVGALLGALFGTLVQLVLPEGTAPPNAYAVVGMGAMLAATTHAPLMSILMVFEMTMDYQIVLPLMLAIIVAHYTSRRYSGVRPMYAESLLPRERPNP